MEGANMKYHFSETILRLHINQEQIMLNNWMKRKKWICFDSEATIMQLVHSRAQPNKIFGFAVTVKHINLAHVGNAASIQTTHVTLPNVTAYPNSDTNVPKL
jgi:hypothetical protein